MRLNSRMHIWYTKILRKVLLNSDAGEFHPQEYNIHLVVGREDPADACSSVVPPHCSEGSSEYCLCLVPTITRLTQIKRNGGAVSENFWNWNFRSFPSFPIFSISFLFNSSHSFFSLCFQTQNSFGFIDLRKQKQTKNHTNLKERTIHLPSANTLTDAGYRPSCEVNQTCSVSH